MLSILFGGGLERSTQRFVDWLIYVREKLTMRIYLIRTTGSAFIHHCLYLSFDKKRLSNSSYLLACLSKPFAIRFMLFLCFVFRCLRASGLNIFIYIKIRRMVIGCVFFFPVGGGFAEQRF